MQVTRMGGWLAAAIISAASPAAYAQVDFSGTWGQLMHEDRAERGAGPDFADYTGLPINDAARLRAESWDAAKWTVPEHQCEPHPADYAPHGPAGLRIWSTVDVASQQVVAWHMTHAWMVTTRTIWMDGRPHPPPTARHKWMGFSTGKWEGDTLVVKTTHLKEGWIRRNGVPRSDRGTLTEYFIRHGDYLTLVSVVEDPAYLTEAVIRSWNWVLHLGYQIAPYPCSARVETERPKGFVAHWLPGTNPQLKEFASKRKLPAGASSGGAQTMYPEYQLELQKAGAPQPTSGASPAGAKQ